MDLALRVAPNLSNGATGFHFEINCQAQSAKCSGLWLAPLLPLSMMTVRAAYELAAVIPKQGGE